MIKSPLNYTGGKFKILNKILPLFPQNIDTFVDLFCGGCNVGINVNANKIVFNDNLTYLIKLYNSFKSQGYENVLNHIQNQIEKYNLSIDNITGYNDLRTNYNNTKNDLDLFVLLCYSFNHQIRFNNKHDFNTSFGMNRSCFNDNIKNNLKYFIDKITSNNISFTNLDFTEYDISNLTTNDFVYVDCPYLITTGSYNDGKRGFKGWSETEELQLQDLMLKLISKNIKFALSNVTYHKGKTNNYLIKFISDNNLNINYIENSYANSNYQTFDRNPNSSIEVLITNYK